jgi:hypothetical protein
LQRVTARSRNSAPDFYGRNEWSHIVSFSNLAIADNQCIRENIMKTFRLLGALITAAGIASLTGCVVAPPYAYAPAPAYGYGYAPGYYAAPAVDIGVGVGGYYGHGWRH